jgi:hypothetical protein
MMSDKASDGGDWYCPTCEDYVSGETVTYEEVHEICGTFIGESWQRERAALETRLSKMERALREIGDVLVAMPPLNDDLVRLRDKGISIVDKAIAKARHLSLVRHDIRY